MLNIYGTLFLSTSFWDLIAARVYRSSVYLFLIPFLDPATGMNSYTNFTLTIWHTII